MEESESKKREEMQVCNGETNLMRPFVGRHNYSNERTGIFEGLGISK